MFRAPVVRSAGVWLVLGCLLWVTSAPISVSALAEEMAPGAESPEALVERMKKAGENEDFGEMMACLAPEGRVQMASMMYLMATMMVGFSMMGAEMGAEMGTSMAEGMAEGMGEELTDEQKAEMEAQKEQALAEVAKMQDAYNEMVAKYGLPQLSEEEELPDAELEDILGNIDQAAFMKDVMDFLESMPGQEEESSAADEGAPWDFGDAVLTDLVVEGDTATGKVDGQDVQFVRIDGRWYFDAEMFGGP